MTVNKRKVFVMNTKTEKFILGAEKVKKFIIGSALIFGMGTNSPVFAKSGNSEKTRTEVKQTKKQSQKKKTDYTAVKIDKYSDIEKLFDLSLNIIFAELILEEVPMQNAYDDYGLFRGKKNTIGAGSTYSPVSLKSYNNPEAKWYHLAANQKAFASRKATNEGMLKLIIGWAKYRQHTQHSKTKKFEKHDTILKRMFNQLKGASLRPNEFAALLCAVYNNETNISRLCPFIKKNYSDPVKCANAMMTWWEKTAANAGTKDRCEFEACVYLNVDNFCESMLDMYTCPSKRASCVNVAGVKQKTLTGKNNKTWCLDAQKRYLGVVYHETGKRTGDICQSCMKYFNNPLYAVADAEKVSLQKQYDAAIALYNKKEYKKALEKLLVVEKQGGTGSDLYNDIAITALNLKKYDLCVQYCQKVLKTTEHKKYAKACYNAGMAYEFKGNYDRAILNYSSAIDYYKKYGIQGSVSAVNYESVYSAALERVQRLKKPQQYKAKTK